MRVLPVSSANLSFPVHGIVGDFNVLLGQQVTPFDFNAFSAGLGATAPNAGVLKYNSAGIYDDPVVTASMLMSLRAEPVKAALDKAIFARQAAYWRKYPDVVGLFDRMQSDYSAKTSYLESLSLFYNQQYTALNQAYQNDRRGQVVMSTTSSLTSKTTTSGSTQTTETVDKWYGTDDSGKAVPLYPQVDTTSSGTETPGTELSQTQTVTNTGYTYRTPAIENQIQFYREMLSLIDQNTAMWLAEKSITGLLQVLENELASIDLDVKQMQVAFLNTILLSPIGGIVTHIRKRPGDFVKPGETVVRVEDNSTVILVGTVSAASVLSVNSTGTVTTTLPGATSQTVITGTIVGVDGQRDHDQLWHVAIQCVNLRVVSPPPEIVPILPLNFSLDPSVTTIQIQ